MSCILAPASDKRDAESSNELRVSSNVMFHIGVLQIPILAQTLRF